MDRPRSHPLFPSMIPEPSKRPFRFPVPAEALDHFCHPALPLFAKPVRHGDTVFAANGYAAIRVHRFTGLPEDYQEASPEFLDRWAKLPWSQLDQVPPSGEWRLMDDSRGTIYRDGPLPLWITEQGKPLAFTRD